MHTQVSSSYKKPDFYIIRRLMPYLRSHMWLCLMAVAGMLLSYVLSVLGPVIIQHGIDHGILNKNLPELKKTTVILCIVLIGDLLFQLFYRYIIELLGQKILYMMRMSLLKKVFSLTRSYFDRTPIGHTLTRLTSDLDAIEEFLSDGVVSVIGNSFKVLFILVAMFVLDYQLALVTIFVVPFFLVITFFFRRVLRQGYRGVRRANATINTILVESLNGIKELYLFKQRHQSATEFDTANKEYCRSYQKIIHAYSIYFPVIEVLSHISMVFVLMMSHFLLRLEVQVGEIFAFFIYLNMFFQPLRHLAEQFNTFQSAMAASERIFVLLDTPPDFVVTTGVKPVPRSFFQQAKIEFRNVSFQYKPEEPVLKKVSFTINPGEKVALIGSTGAGKTTITNLLNRLYEIHSGEILINDKDIKTIPITKLMNCITTVTQDVFMFTGTIAENIHLHTYSMEEVYQAAKRSHAHHFIKKFPKQYEHLVLEEGKSLSTGQKQIIALTRAFIRKSPIILLDEATANIDSISEAFIEKALQTLFQSKTALIIAHRLSTIKSADRILVFQRGVLVEEGTHRSLIKQKKGMYRKLYEMQSLSLRS